MRISDCSSDVCSSDLLAVGERLVNRLEPPGGRPITFKPTITEIEDGRALSWLGRLLLPGLFDGRHRFELVPSGEGTRLPNMERFAGALGPFLRKSLDTRTHAGFEAKTTALQLRAGSSTPPPPPPPTRGGHRRCGGPETTPPRA